MKTNAVRIYGKNDLRLEEFELPPLGDDEILAKILTNSICMSDHKAALQGEDHKRVPDNVAENPIIIGHEFCGELVEIGSKWQHRYSAGQKFTLQTALNKNNSMDAPGYSFPYIGGNATYVNIPNDVMDLNCLLTYNGDAFFSGSMSEPYSCIIGSFHANYHTKRGSYEYDMGIIEGGNLALIAGAGPMGIGAIDYATHCDRKPGLIVVTDIDDSRLHVASRLITVEEAAKNGVKLVYKNSTKAGELLALTDGRGYDDVFVYVPVASVIELADDILGRDGCLNFFAGPTDPMFKAPFNFYNVHYASTHIVGTTGGNTNDMAEALTMMENNLLDPATMISHIGGIDSAVDAIINLNKIPGGKKLIYTHISMPLTAIEDFDKQNDPLFQALSEIIKSNNGLWCKDAENYLLEHSGSLQK